MSAVRSLSGGKRTWTERVSSVENDPERTIAATQSRHTPWGPTAHLWGQVERHLAANVTPPTVILVGSRRALFVRIA